MKLISLLVLIFSLLVGFNHNALAAVKEAPETHTAASKDGNVTVPFIAYEPETEIMLGTYFMHYYHRASDSQPDVFMGRLIITQKEQLSLTLGIDQYCGDRRYRYKSNLSYSRWSNDFYGIGNRDEDREGENYDSINLKFDSSIFKKLRENLYIGPTVYFNRYRMKEKTAGGLLAQNVIPGSNGATLVGGTINLVWDERDSVFWPTQGFLWETKLGGFTDASGEDFDFSHFDCDYRLYKAVAARKVWAFQGRVQLNQGDIPFQFLPGLGGSTLMRGCPSGKYTDKNLVAFQTEYRYPVNQKYSGTVFAGFGETAPDIKDFSWDEIKTAYGVGVRIAVDQRTKMNMRFDLGFSPSDHGIYFMIGEAF